MILREWNIVQRLEVPNSGITLEAGHTDYDNHNDEWFFKLNFSISKVNKDRSFISERNI